MGLKAIALVRHITWLVELTEEFAIGLFVPIVAGHASSTEWRRALTRRCDRLETLHIYLLILCHLLVLCTIKQMKGRIALLVQGAVVVCNRPNVCSRAMKPIGRTHVAVMVSLKVLSRGITNRILPWWDQSQGAGNLQVLAVLKTHLFFQRILFDGQLDELWFESRHDILWLSHMLP